MNEKKYFKISERFKEIIVKTGRQLYQQNLTIGTWGNISVLDSKTGLVYIKPSAMEYDEIGLDDVAVLDKDGKIIEGSKKPSVESPMHLAIYKNRKDVFAVIHYHAIYSGVFAVTGLSLPGISEDFVQIIGEKVVCAEYALPGTNELAEKAIIGLQNRNAVFLANHGTICVGKNIKEAMKVVYALEKTAQIYILSKNLGKCRVIPEREIKKMQHFMKNEYNVTDI